MKKKDDSDIKGRVAELLSHEKKVPKPRKVIPLFPNSPPNQRVVGNGNFQAGGDINITNSTFNQKITTGKITQKVVPPSGTIGANPLLKQRIQALFNELGEAREARFGKGAYPQMYRTFKSDFGIKNQNWTVIWLWPEGMAQDIIDYLQAKFDNSISGRIKKAAAKPFYQHARPYLYVRERELLEHLGLNMKSPQLVDFMSQMFGVTSHADLTREQHQQLVEYIETIVKKMEE